jgi:hypothetical protein
MRRLILSLAMIALAAFATVTATAAFAALPTLSLLAGGSLPAELAGTSSTAKTKLETKLGELTGEGYSVQLLWTNLTSNLGPATILFTHVKEKTTECHTAGEETGLVLIDDAEWHLVYISLSPLLPGFLLLIPQFTITCGEVKEKAKGSALVSASPFEEWLPRPPGSLKATSKCLSNLKPGLTKYWNDGGEAQTAKLEAELNGLGKFEEACENIENEISLTPTQTIEIAT